MSPSRSLEEALGAIVRLLERQRIPYMVMGGLAHRTYLARWAKPLGMVQRLRQIRRAR